MLHFEASFLKVEEEGYDDEEDGMKSTRTSKTTLTSPGPPAAAQADRITYRYQLRPSSSGRRSNAGAGSDAGSVALSDKYKRVGRPSRPKSDDQVSGWLMWWETEIERGSLNISTISIL